MDIEQAKETFRARVLGWAEKLDIEVESIHIRDMTRKWASCSTRGRLTFDVDLLPLAPHLQDYVIVHELLHFHAPNHGRLWKSLMHAHLGEYEKSETELTDSLRPRFANNNSDPDK